MKRTEKHNIRNNFKFEFNWFNYEASQHVLGILLKLTLPPPIPLFKFVTPLDYSFLRLRTKYKSLMMKPCLHRAKPRPHGRKEGISFCYHLTHNQLASHSRLKYIKSKRLAVGTIFHISFRFQDIRSYYNSHIKNMHLKISYWNYVSYPICKYQHINKKILWTQTTTYKLLFMLPVCGFWCTQGKNIHSSIL